MGYKVKENISKEIQQNFRKHNMRAFWKRINGNKTTSQKSKGLRGSSWGSLSRRTKQTPNIHGIHTKRIPQNRDPGRVNQFPSRNLSSARRTGENTYAPTSTKTGKSRLSAHFKTKTRARTKRCNGCKIWRGDVRGVIDQLNRREAGVADNIIDEILRRNKDWVSPLLTDLLNVRKYNGEMYNEWIRRIVTFRRKNKDPVNHDNYRHIALLNMICKIWACIFGNRLESILNLLAGDAHAAYRPNRSTIDVISLIENDSGKATRTN